MTELKELLESPLTVYDKEIPIITGVTIGFYSDDSVKDIFDCIGQYEIGDDTFFTCIAKK